MRLIRRLCVYCGSSSDVDARYHEAAAELGRALVDRGIELVFGGGRVGLMGTLADAVLAGGGRVYGVIPEKLQALELAHEGCTELFLVDSMHTRKMMMAQLSDAFAALPGGFGTLEELFEATTWAQLNYHRKPVGLLNVDGFYDPLLAFIRRANAEGFIRDLHADLISVHTTPTGLIEGLSHADIPELHRWMPKP